MEYIEQNYGSTLVFCVGVTELDKSDMATSRAQVKVRMFKAESLSLNSYGHWKCDFTETLLPSTRVVSLELFLQWVQHKDTGLDQESPSSVDRISQIKTIKAHSDSTLSELFIDKVDGQSILKGDAIQVKLEAGRVEQFGQYKFRVSLYTQDISQARFLDKPVFPSFLDLDTSFDPVKCKKDIRPDVCFQFPVSRHCAAPVIIHAHSSELKGSKYLCSKMTELGHEQKQIKKEEDMDSIFVCTVTGFSPVVFHVMLQYMYTGKLVLKPHGYCDQKNRDYNHAKRCHFEDLYRIAERYEIQSLKEQALKAVRHTLNMSIATSLLTKIPLDGLEGDYLSHAEKTYQQLVRKMAMNIVKDYIAFFSIKIFVLQGNKHPEDLSIHERQHMISYLGEYVLANLGRLWSA